MLITNLLNKKLTNKIYLIFDLDGTIISTDEANFLSYREAIKEVKNIDLRLLYKSNKRFTRKKLNLIVPNLTIEEFEKIIEIKTNIFHKYLQRTKPNKAILEIIKKFSETNKIILATNSHKVKAELLLKHYDLFDMFDKKYYKENYTDSKNNKYKYILNDLGVLPNDIVVFEDNQDEIEKANLLNIPFENIIKPKGEKYYE